MSFDSLKATNKENRKAYQENGYLASFLNDNTHDAVLLTEYDKSSLINVIRTLNPVVVVDESHNAESTLSVDMLRNLNPSFIFDLTATPKGNSSKETANNRDKSGPDKSAPQSKPQYAPSISAQLPGSGSGSI